MTVWFEEENGKLKTYCEECGEMTAPGNQGQPWHLNPFRLGCARPPVIEPEGAGDEPASSKSTESIST